VPGRAAKKLPYHHGDLRRSVLDGALESIAVGGPAALNLRDVARRAGVSHAAPAHHFGDKAGVLTAIAAEGYALLVDAMRAALAADGESLIGVGIAYIRFALDHRAHFEEMFRPEFYDHAAIADERQAAAEILFGVVRRTLPGASEEEVWGGVLAAWSFTHGFATLSLDTNFEPERVEDVETAVRRAGASVERLSAAGAFDG
jgi:AcrR family transcriptional regulator